MRRGNFCISGEGVGEVLLVGGGEGGWRCNKQKHKAPHGTATRTARHGTARHGDENRTVAIDSTAPSLLS